VLIGIRAFFFAKKFSKALEFGAFLALEIGQVDHILLLWNAIRVSH